jgi:putative DNA primase/helicase
VTTGTGERFVATADIRAAIKGRETDLLDALGVLWRDGRPHINSPYRGHSDKNPSWRWDERKRRAICTCGSDSILNVLMKIEAINFQDVKLRAAELLNRNDLIIQRNRRQRKGQVLSANQAGKSAQLLVVASQSMPRQKSCRSSSCDRSG